MISLAVIVIITCYILKNIIVQLSTRGIDIPNIQETKLYKKAKNTWGSE